MKLIPQTPKRALNKAFLKQRPLRSEIDLFKRELITLLDHIDDNETEEFHKNLVSSFLKKAIYQDNNFINTKGRQDLVIHTGKDNKTQVGVIIEAKRPENKSDWFTTDNPNGKALHELVLYYLRERIESNNIDIKYLIATNINEWYIIEASYFEKLFYRNKQFVKQYEEWRDGKKVTRDTYLFYNDIAKPFINGLTDEIPCTYFNIKDYEKVLRNEDKADDKNLIALLKILSPYHLLKVPFTNDSNELDEKFYKELLYIIGLEEVKEGSKNVIRRKKLSPNLASLLEKAIDELKTEGLHKVPDIKSFGDTIEDQYFNIALELCLTWINRILFLKLLEGQLVNYHKGDKQYRFLNTEIIQDFDELFKLFHKVLAINVSDRTAAIKQKYSRVPYLNSSLFEISELEDQTIKINSLDNSSTLEILSTSVLKTLKKKNDRLPTLDYLFHFLDAYDFASEGKEDIEEDNKKLINASVLGKVFEKINGYKDGSIYTPGFITMYMCRQSIRLAVVQKFNEAKKWNIKKFDELYNKIEDINEASHIINDLKICDPAVGSGHFLVSALNEIIAIKSELQILKDKNGKRLKEYSIEVANDELIVTDEDGDIFEYKPQNKESQRVQETLFKEKQTIIENCLFGVDINPNSVKICRLRLWIELLKNAYYQEESGFSELETLPNIDINIKCGNSLLSRFALDADLREVFRKQKFNLTTYKILVETYRTSKSRSEKMELLQLIEKIKNEYTKTIYNRDPRRKKISEIRGQLELVQNNFDLFGKKLSDSDKLMEERRLTLLLQEKEKQLDEAEKGTIFKNAFEWRFEFPEVLNDNGNFEGFDIVIGNPPYIRHEEIKHLKQHLEKNYVVFNSIADILTYFFELGNNILKPKGILSFIVSNKFFKASYGNQLRTYLVHNTLLQQIIEFDKLNIFNEATVKAAIIQFSKEKLAKIFTYVDVIEKPDDLAILVINAGVEYEQFLFNSGLWIFQSEKHWNIYHKINKYGTALNEWDLKINFGIKTGFNEAFLIDEETKNQLIKEHKSAAKVIKPLFRGREVEKYFSSSSNSYLIGTFPALKLDIENYPSIKSHLLKFGRDKLEQSGKPGARKKTTNKWFETQDTIAFWKELNLPKIIWKRIGSKLRFCYDETGFCSLDSTCIATGKQLKYLVGVLNSKMIEKELNRYAPKTGTGDLIISVQALSPLEIPIPTKIQEKQMNELVDKIIVQKQQGKDSTENERKIDELVYKLYNLTPDDIAIVEAETSFK